MTASLISPLPYHHDTTALFEAVADHPWAVFLDSAHGSETGGRYDIVSFAPEVVLTTRGALTEIRRSDSSTLSREDPFDLLRTQLQPRVAAAPGLPFSGGALGYFGYDLGRRLEHLPTLAKDDQRLPEMAVGIYDWALVVDHRMRNSWLVGQGRDPRTRDRWRELVALFSAPRHPKPRRAFRVRGAVRYTMSEEAYARAFRRIQAYIRAGDCYQVNLAQRFSTGMEGDPWLAYRALRGLSPTPYSAYLNSPEAQLLCTSPERFLRVEQGRVLTQPIKGTCPRAPGAREDRLRARALLESRKDRAENLMIVDLLRNDLSKCCALHSVKVPRLFELQHFVAVHHLVSSITGHLRDDRDALDLLRACFPGGSITGTPKLRAMEIIEELEPLRRGPYCGAIGYIGFNGAMDTNITIRTMVHTQGDLSFWAGGGIVADSSMEGEYRESFHKATAMFRLIGSDPEPDHVGGS